MQTPFGEIAVLDAHAHFFSDRFFRTLASQMPNPPGEDQVYSTIGEKVPWEFPEKDPASLAQKWVAEMDKQSLDRMALIASVPNDEESIAAGVKAYPERIVGYFMLNPVADGAAARAERAFSELGLKGVCLFPAMHRYSIWDKRLHPVFESARRSRAIVFVHCGHLKVGIRDLLGLASPFEMRFANPVDLHGVAKQYPEVPFVVPHFGCGYFRELLMVADQCPNIYIDTSSSNGWVKLMPYELTLRDLFQKSLKIAGSGRLLFGTDSSFFPRAWRRDIFEEQVKVLRDLNVKDEDAAAILGGNLSRLLGSD